MVAGFDFTGFLSGFRGAVLFFITGAIFKSFYNFVCFWGGDVRFTADRKYFFGGGHQDNSVVAGSPRGRFLVNLDCRFFPLGHDFFFPVIALVELFGSLGDELTIGVASFMEC